MIDGCLIGQGSHSNSGNEQNIIRRTGANRAADRAVRVGADVFHPPDMQLNGR